MGVTVNYRSVPTLTYYTKKYGYRPNEFPVSYQWGEGTISLPLYYDLSEEDQEYVVQSVKETVLPLIERLEAAPVGNRSE